MRKMAWTRVLVAGGDQITMRLTRGTVALLLALTTPAIAQEPGGSIAPSPAWTQAMPPGPVVRTKITESYATLVARDTYFWAWPLVNMYKVITR